MSASPLSAPHLNPNVIGLTASATLAINERSDALIADGHRVFKLGLGQSPFPVPTEVVAEVSGRSQRVALPAGGKQQLVFSLGPGYPYEGRWVWTASVSSSTGFVPMFHEASTDTRFLGVRVKPTLQ